MPGGYLYRGRPALAVQNQLLMDERDRHRRRAWRDQVPPGCWCEWTWQRPYIQGGRRERWVRTRVVPGCPVVHPAIAREGPRGSSHSAATRAGMEAARNAGKQVGRPRKVG